MAAVAVVVVVALAVAAAVVEDHLAAVPVQGKSNTLPLTASYSAFLLSVSIIGYLLELVLEKQRWHCVRHAGRR